MEWILLFGLPLVITLNGQAEIPKVFTAEILIGILWLLALWKNLKINMTALWPFLLFGGYILVRGGDWTGNGFRLQGIIVQLVLLSLGALVAIREKSVPPKRVVWVAVTCLILGILFLQSNIAGRAVGTLGEPNALASVFVFSWPFVGPWGLLVALGVAATARSRSAGIALAIQAVIWLLTKKLNKSLRKSLLFGCGLLVLSLGLPYLDQNRIWENRTQVWNTAWMAGWQKPLFGWGFGKTEEAINETAISLNNTIRYQRVDSSHNIFLDYWVQGGIAGLGCWLWVVSKAFYGLVKNKRVTESIALVGVIAVMCFNPASIVTLVHFWWLVGRGMV